MIAKVLGGIAISAVIAAFVPTDGAELERLAGVDVLPETEYGISYHRLPEAELVPEVDYPKKIDLQSKGIVTTARAAIVVDDATGTVLYAKRPDDVRSIASVTKLMTALVFMDQDPDLSETVMLDPEQDLVTGGRQYVGFFEPIRLSEVLEAAMVGSDNSATRSLMRFSGLSEEAFVEAMNAKAAAIGMESTVFRDPTGIDPYNMSTARDLVKLLRAIEEVPDIQQFTIEPSATITHAGGREVAVQNTNGLLNTFVNQGPYNVVGGKTGFLPQARYVLTSTVERDGNAVHIVVLGSETISDRVQEVKALAEWAFRVHKWPE